MGFDLVACTDDARWDALLATSPHGSVFATSAFLRILEVDVERWLVCEGAEPVLGAVLLLEGGAVLPAPFPFTLYQGLLQGESLTRMPTHRRVRRGLESMQFLLAELEPRHSRLSFCIHPALDDLRAVSWFHHGEADKGTFRLDLRYTAFLDLGALADFEQYLQDIRPVRREEQRKARNAGCTVEASTDIAALDRLHALTFDRQGLTRSTREERLLTRIAQAAIEGGWGELLACRDPTGAIASVILLLEHQGTAYYMFAANHPDHRKNGSSTFLMLEGLRRCHERGLRTFDMVGINSPNRGDFKTSFNARPAPYFVATWNAPGGGAFS